MEEIKVGEYIRTKDGIIRKYHHPSRISRESWGIEDGL